MKKFDTENYCDNCMNEINDTDKYYINDNDYLRYLCLDCVKNMEMATAWHYITLSVKEILLFDGWELK